MNIALFDLDNTLIKGDSDYQWGNYLVENNYVDPVSYSEKNENYFDQYRKGTLCAKEFAEFSYEPLTKFDYDTLISIRKQFFEEKIKPLILPKAVDLVRFHKEKKDILAIVTATNSFISKVSADYFEIKNLLASEPEFINNKFTGKLLGDPCFQEGKVKKVKEWMKLNNYNNYDDIYFYTDSHNDIQLLEYCTKPIAVDPDKILEDLSKKNNWQIMSLR